MKRKWNNTYLENTSSLLLTPSHPSNYTLPVFRLGLCSMLFESLSSISILLLLSLSDKKSLCWDKESLSEWLADGVSDLWLAGEDDLDGDSKNFLIAGWLKTIVSHVFDPCKNESKQIKLLIFLKPYLFRDHAWNSSKSPHTHKTKSKLLNVVWVNKTKTRKW